MQVASVIGKAVSTIKHQSMVGSKLLVVQPYLTDGKTPDGFPLLALDTIGAGETFFAAFLARLRQGEWCHLSAIQNAVNTIGEETLSEALAYANTAAAINISRPGCSPPTKKEIEQYNVPRFSKGECP